MLMLQVAATATMYDRRMTAKYLVGIVLNGAITFSNQRIPWKNY